MSNKYPGGIITSGANAGYSVAFDGTGDYLSIANNTALDLTGDFTIECWVYLTNVSPGYNPTIVARWGASGGQIYTFQVLAGGTFRFITSAGTWTGGSVSANTWTHLAVSRSGSSLRLFNAGALSSTNTDSTSLSGTQVTSIGGESNGAQSVPGYVSNVRIVKGTALYTAAFTPPTQLFAITNTSLLTCNSPAIVDQSSNAFTITANGNAAVSTFTPFTGTQLVPNPNTLANTQGVWSISDAAYWMSQNKWPMPPNYPLQSLRFNSADSTYLNRTPGSAGNRRTWTYSAWVKRCKLSTSADTSLISGYQSGTVRVFCGFEAGDTLQVYADAGAINVQTSAVFRDVGAWYHVVIAFDTTQATSTNRIKMYVNGVQQTQTGTYPNQNTDWSVNNTVAQYIGTGTTASYADFYLSNITFVDGQALTPSSFGANDPNTGVWSPVPYSGTYGTNGFRLSFQDNTGTTATTLGKDYSGNGNNWTPNNFSVAAGSGNDSLTDTPTNWGIDYGNGGEVRGNYATFNSIDNIGSATFSDGNLQIVTSSTNVFGGRATMSVSSGKWYWEMTPTSNVTAGECAIGIDSATSPITSAATGIGFTATSYSYRNSGLKVNNSTGTSYGASYTNNDVIGVALDLDAGTLVFYKNGVSQGTAFSSLSGSFTPAMSDLSGGNGTTLVANFGQRPFAYPAPSGFKVLCTTNLPIPTVGATSTTQANKYMDVSLYTGTGAVQSVTNSGSMQPDFVWLKNRNSTEWHSLFDAVRGALQNIRSNTTNAEVTATGTLTSFNSNGFSLGTDPSSYGVNTNTFTYVAWQWKANGAGSSNTAGSITSTVSANTTAGISVVTYTGNGSSSATVGHGLGVAPKMIIVKRRNGTGDWESWHAGLSANNIIRLNTTAAQLAISSTVNGGLSSSPTSSLFSFVAGSSNVDNVNANTATYVAYCFAEIAGFSRFGSFTGNGSTDGPFVYCGFRPRFVMIKNASNVANWTIVDTSRNTYNVANARLFPSNSDAESTAANNCDILSNGFKVRNGTDTGVNTNNETYIFAVFAESPFNYSRAR